MNIKSLIKKYWKPLIIGFLLAAIYRRYGDKIKNYLKPVKKEQENKNEITTGLPSSSGNDLNRPLGGSEVGINIISPPIQSEVNVGSWFGRGAVNQERELDGISQEL
jgi:hypothetical protein